MEDIKGAVEAIVFAANSPVTVRQIRETLGLDDPAGVREALSALKLEYEERDGGIGLVEVAGGYQFRTNPRYSEQVNAFRRSPRFRLTRASLETLAIVAYRQPSTRAEIEALRGVDVGGVLKHLLTKGLLRIVGRKESPGRPILYGTTKKFLSVFDLKDLGALPPLKEMEELDLGQEVFEE